MQPDAAATVYVMDFPSAEQATAAAQHVGPSYQAYDGADATYSSEPLR